MLKPEDIIKKVYLEESVVQEEIVHDPADLIQTDTLVKRLFILCMFVYERIYRRNTYERKNLPWPYDRMRDIIFQYGIKFTPPKLERPNPYYQYRGYGGFLKSNMNLAFPSMLYQIATLPREKQHELYDVLFPRIKSNFEYVAPANHRFNTIADGTFFMDYEDEYQAVAEYALKIAEVERGNKEAGANLDF